MENMDILEKIDLLVDALVALRKKRDLQSKMKRRSEYRKNKTRIKNKARIRRHKPQYKKYLRKKKKMATRGKTSTGKRMTKYVN